MSKNTSDGTHQTHILVVDDEPDVRLLLAREISDRGYEVVAVTDSAQAIEEMGRGDFDVVLTDVRMPGMDGMGLTEWIKRTRPDTDVVVMTGYASIESAVTAIHLGAFDYLVKPFGEMDLVTSSIDRAILKRGLKEDLRWSGEELRASLSLVRNQPEEIRDKAARDSSALVNTQPSDSSVSTRSQNSLLKELEGRVIIETLSQLGNDISAAAKRLGVSKATLYRKLKIHGISGYRTFIVTDQK